MEEQLAVERGNNRSGSDPDQISVFPGVVRWLGLSSGQGFVDQVRCQTVTLFLEINKHENM